MKISIAVATILGISTLVLAVPAGADWQYTDDKGKRHKVILKMDVPRQYSNTAVEVDGSAHGSNTVVPAGVPTLPVLKPEQQPSAAVAARQPEPERPREPAVALPVGARLLGFAPPELGLSADSVVAQLAPAPAKPGFRQPGLQPFAAGAVA